MTAPVITIYVRHTPGCKYVSDELARRFNCRKHLRWTASGKQHRRTAGTRSWAGAEERKREIIDQFTGRALKPKSKVRDLGAAIQVFIQDKTVQGLSDSVIQKYVLGLTRLQEYCSARGVHSVQGITRKVITGFCVNWSALYPSSLTRTKLRERYESFLRYCYEAQWLERIPVWPAIKIDTIETQPLTAEEYACLLASVGVAMAAGDTRRRTEKNNGRRSPDEEEQTTQKVRAFLQCMRWAGLSLRDAVTLPKTGLTFDAARGVHRVTAKRVKTGTDVSLPIPPDVAVEILSVAATNVGAYVFWTGEGKPQSVTSNWGQRLIVPVFKAAGLHGDCLMVSHRLRDTFAVHLLESGHRWKRSPGS